MALMVNVAKLLIDACYEQQKNVRRLTRAHWLEWTRANALKAAELFISANWPALRILTAKAYCRFTEQNTVLWRKYRNGEISTAERYRLAWLLLWRMGCIDANRNTTLVCGERFWKVPKSAKVPAKKRIPGKQAASNPASKGKGKSKGRKVRST